jgi:non-homologous end joining protein Ku
MAFSVWQATVSFGLLTIPIRLCATASTRSSYPH